MGKKEIPCEEMAEIINTVCGDCRNVDECDGSEYECPAFKAYLAEKARAEKNAIAAVELAGEKVAQMMRAERYRQALNCECEDGFIEKYGWDDEVVGVEPCPACAEIRKEAKRE